MESLANDEMWVQLREKQDKIEDLEKEVERLTAANARIQKASDLNKTLSDLNENVVKGQDRMKRRLDGFEEWLDDRLMNCEKKVKLDEVKRKLIYEKDEDGVFIIE